MRHLKKFENFTEEFIVPEEVVGNELCTCNGKPCVCKEEEEEEEEEDPRNPKDPGADEDNMKLEKFSAFNEKKKATPTPAQKKAREEFAKRIKGEKSDDKKAPAKKSDAKGKVPETEAEKKLAAKYGDKKRITKGDFIKAAIDNKKKKESKEK
jgi:hypothetical protein